MWIVLSVLAITLLCLYCKRFLDYWKLRNIDGPSALPLVGNMSDYLMGKKHFAMVYNKIYR